MKNCVLCGVEFKLRTISLYCADCGPLVADIQADVGKVMLLAGVPSARGHSCVDCGKPATARDHRYYAEPLAVDFVCTACNGKRGLALDLADLVAARKRFKMPIGRMAKTAQESERDALVTALEHAHWNRAKAARALGIGYRAMRYQMVKYGLGKSA